MMIRPQEPKNETQRLQALHSLHILDTKAEERFDRITRVAQNLFHVPIASVSFVDKEREWYKSKYGLPFKETPRSISFGGHVILQEEIMIVTNTLQDVRFIDNPLVLSEPDIRFYVGCPLKIKGQYNIGTLGLMAHHLHQFSPADLHVLKDLAATVEAEFAASHLATMDPLTALSNRQGLSLIGKQIVKICNQHDKSLLLLYFDLSHMHQINQDYGYEEGDRLLKIFAEQLLKNFRHSDAVGRVGEDKFAALCGGMRPEHFPNVIKRLQHKLAALALNYKIEFQADCVAYNRLAHYTLDSLINEGEAKMAKNKGNYH